MATYTNQGTGSLLKAPLKRVAVFGANGRIGKEVARAIANQSPETELRLLVRNQEGQASVSKEFPDADVQLADYYDQQSLSSAFDGVDGIFIVTPNRLDEERAMQNLVFAAREHVGQIRHVVRLLGDPPGMTMASVPDQLRNAPGGTAIQHIIAKDILLKSRLPITYVNIAAYFMQNFSGPLFSLALRKYRILSCPYNRRMAFIDAADIGRSCAALFASQDHRHIGKTYHLDNGIDVMPFDEVAALMSKVWGEEITFDDSEENFLNIKYTGDIDKAHPPMQKEDYWISYSRFEQDNQTAWRKTDIVEYLTGNPAKSLEQWLSENRDAVLESTDMPRVF